MARRSVSAQRRAALLAAVALAALAGCSKAKKQAGPPPPVQATIGAAGGTLTAADGAQIVIPPGALASDTVIAIRQSTEGMPPLPVGHALTGPVWELTPHDIAFQQPVTLRFPNSGSGEVSYLVASPLLGWREVRAMAANGRAEVQARSLSWWGQRPIVGCTPSSDPYACAYAFTSGETLASDPMGALVDRIADYRMGAPGTLVVGADYFAPGDCVEGRMRVIRWRNVSPAMVVQVVRNDSVAFAPYASNSSYGTGAYRAELVVPNTEVGTWQYFLELSCRRAGSTSRITSVWPRGFWIVFDLPDPATHSTVGGTVSGLTGPGLVLQDNGGDDIALPADGAFVFPTALANGSAYAVTVKTQPAGGRVCTVANGSGVASANVTSVQVSCGPPQFTVGGTVSGLNGAAGLVLQNNGADDRAIATDGPFTFAQGLPAGATYAVTVRTQPSGRYCIVSNGTGTVAGSVSNVAVTCGSPGASELRVELDWATGLDLPVAGIAYYGGAALLDNGTLRLLGLTDLRAGSVATVSGVAGLRPVPVGTGSNSNLRVLLYSTDGSGGSCPLGNELQAIAIFQKVEGGTWISPPMLLHTSAEITPGVSGCIFGATGAHTPRGFEFAVADSDGTLTAGTLTISFDSRTETWGIPGVSETPLPLTTDCPAAALDPGTMAGVYDATIGSPTGPTRIAALAFQSGAGSVSATCAATEDPTGVWSGPVPVWDNGVDATGAPVVARPTVVIDATGAVQVAGSRRVAGDYQLATAFLAATGSQWQQESLPALGEVSPALELDQTGTATLLYRTQPNAAAAFTTVYASRRSAGGTWSARQRLPVDDGDTRYPRLAVAGNGDVLALFQYAGPGAPFQVQAARWSAGAWDPVQDVQPFGSPEGRFAVAPRHPTSGGGDLRGVRVFWRETHPTDTTRHRIMSAVPVP